jgi:hypothetical protein
VPWGIDEIDEETIAVLLLGDVGGVTLGEFIVQGDCPIGRDETCGLEPLHGGPMRNDCTLSTHVTNVMH